MTITVYAAHNYPAFLKGIVRDLRVLWALEELDLRYDIHWMDFGKSEHRESPNRLINPFGKIPSMVDGAQRMFETGAIVLYLYENSGRAPQDAHSRADLNQWCFAALNTIEPVFIEIFRWDIFWKDKEGREWRRAELSGLAHERLTDLSRALGEKHYLVGNNFSAADILMLSVLDFCRHDTGLFEAHPRIAAYIARCHARPAYQRALAKQGVGPQANAA
jgi:glutathione S-transferase